MSTRKGMGGHQQSVGKNQEWLTDPEILKALGPFDLDPCAPVIRPWDIAKVHYTIEDDGLSNPWFGRVFMNPPYDRRHIHKWLSTMAHHANGITLIFARTETENFQQWVFGYASSILFPKGRLRFFDIYGNPATTSSGEKANGGAPSVIIAYGDQNSQAIAESGIPGAHLPVNTVPIVVVGISPTWKAVITIAVNRNGGEADVQAVYNLVETIAPDKVASNPHYKEQIRKQLQYHFTRIAKGRYTTTNRVK